MILLPPILLLLQIIPLTTSSRVLELSDRFTEFRKEGVWLVKFYAPWCGHCKKLEPIYAHVAQQLHDTPVRVGKVDCTRFPSLAKEFNVNGFPTVMFISPSHAHTYTGDRTAEALVSYTKRMLGPAVKSPSDSYAFPHAHFHGNKNSELFKAFSVLAGMYRHHLDFIGEFDGDENEVQIRHLTTTQKFTKIHGNLTQQLEKFINSNRFPKFLKINRHNFQHLLATDKLVAMAVVEEDKIGKIVQEQFLSNFEKFSELEQFEGLQFGYTGSPDMANSIAMATLPLPSLLVVNASSHHHWILPLTTTTTDFDWKGVVGEFLELVAKGEIEPLGGLSPSTRLYRMFYELTTNLSLMFHGNPILTTLLFGLPFGFLSLICYSICCGDILEEEEEEDVAMENNHEKRE